MKKNFDVTRDVVVAKMLKLMEQGVVPWKKPWFGMNKCYQYVSGRPYNMLNELMLSEEGGYITKSQLFKLGGKMKDGETWKERCVPVVGCFQKSYKLKDENGNEVLDENGDPKSRKFSYLKYWYVVNVKYTTLPAKRRKVYTPPAKSRTAEKVLEKYIKNSGVTYNAEVSDKAYYSPMFDIVVTPKMEQFKTNSEYYSTVFHEMGHSTGHPQRLNRFQFGDAVFGSELYAKEELVAEFVASILCNWCGVSTEKSDMNSASYLKSWAKAIKDDPKMFTYAAYKASDAVRLILDREIKPIVEPTKIEQ